MRRHREWVDNVDRLGKRWHNVLDGYKVERRVSIDSSYGVRLLAVVLLRFKFVVDNGALPFAAVADFACAES